MGDTYFAQDCGAVTTTAATSACASQATLDNFFPYTLYNGHPYETDFASDGTISTINGVRMWVANAPLPAAQGNTTIYRIYYELNGNVYMGYLQKNGATYQYAQADGSVVNYFISLNQAAVNSIQQGIITGASVPGSQAGTSTVESGTTDLFGIGGHAVNGALAPVDLLRHYDIPANLNGAGQTIAIVDAPSSDNIADDLNTYSQAFNLPLCNSSNPCFQQIDLSNGAPIPTGHDWGAEPALDTQMVHAIAPAAKIILVTAKSDSQSDLFAAINYAAALPGVTSVSMSFGYFPAVTDAQNEDAALTGFQANQGTTFFASSGDGGYAGWTASYPASSPYVTAVGGTRINSVGWTMAAQSEVAWKFSGGSVSGFATIPAWQTALLPATVQSNNFGMRAVPDVAAVADFQHSGLAIYYKQRWVMSGGTSASAPIWAGISALFGQYLGNKGSSLQTLVKMTPGGFNGLLYQNRIVQGNKPGLIDIVSGSNNLSNTPCNICSAVVGYDNVTGLGVPDVNQLLSYF